MMRGTAIKISKDEDGSAILACGRVGVHSRPHIKRLTNVNLEIFNKIEAASHLSGFRRALLAYRLNHYRARFDLHGELDKRSADTAVARWIANIEKSIDRIAAASVVDERKYREAIDALVKSANVWAREKSDGDLQRLGFERRHLEDGYVDHGTHDAIEKWFATAKLIKIFATEAQKQLKARDTKSGFKDVWPDEVSREKLLYGSKLPRLYERVTKRTFGISKAKDGDIMMTTGVAFVIEAASAIGLSVTASNVESHYRKAKKR